MAVKATKCVAHNQCIRKYGIRDSPTHTLFHTKCAHTSSPVGEQTHPAQTHQMRVSSTTRAHLHNRAGKLTQTSDAQTKNKDKHMLMLKSAKCGRHNPVPSQNVLILSAK